MTIDRPLVYASSGAVKQDGPLLICICKTCGDEIVFATSRKTNKKYPVNIRRGHLDQRFYMKNDIHKCERP
jgi:hypothetical protein